MSTVPSLHDGIAENSPQHYSEGRGATDWQASQSESELDRPRLLVPEPPRAEFPLVQAETFWASNVAVLGPYPLRSVAPGAVPVAGL